MTFRKMVDLLEQNSLLHIENGELTKGYVFSEVASFIKSKGENFLKMKVPSEFLKE
jgi:hypothetical protein